MFKQAPTAQVRAAASDITLSGPWDFIIGEASVHAVLTRTEALTSHPGLTRPTVPLWQETQNAAATDAAALALTRSIPLMTLIERARCALGPEHSQRPMQIDLHDGSLSMPLESRPLIHALTRVLHNACRFSAHTHAVKVRSRTDWADGFDRVVITICDRGVGMTRAHQQHAFEAHWKATPCAAGPSTGMGLTVARHLVEAQGGWLELRSALGIGTEVELWLPAPISADRPA